ncbi:hypothetical protein C8R46DRAFT_1235623 [Mycena filopes]|nr:hypothetical protein C8R46DRAFT_1235623 [Mycena filopes]
MSDPSSSTTPPTVRSRGRGKSRGGLGKYLRARGRGRGLGRPAEFGKRLVLEGEEEDEEEAAERAAELAQKFSRRQLGTNADRYAQPEPVPDSDGALSCFHWAEDFVHIPVAAGDGYFRLLVGVVKKSSYRWSD